MTKFLRKINKLWVFIGGALAVLAALLVRLACGSPHWLVLRADSGHFLPPLWVLTLLWLGGYFFMGCAWGHIFSLRPLNPCRDAWRWRGSTFLVLTMVFSLMWYPLLFGMSAWFFSWLCLGLTVVLGGICALYWFRVSQGAALVLSGVLIWYIYLFLLQLTVMLHI